MNVVGESLDHIHVHVYNMLPKFNKKGPTQPREITYLNFM